MAVHVLQTVLQPQPLTYTVTYLHLQLNYSFQVLFKNYNVDLVARDENCQIPPVELWTEILPVNYKENTEIQNFTFCN